jgi:hypothetical protein
MLLESIPHKRPQLLSIIVGIVAKLLFELADNRDWVLERIFPACKGPGVGRVGRHSRCELDL